LTALEDYLEEYKGVLVIVSHDRFFTDKVTDHLFVFEGNGVVKDFTGTLTDYAEALVEIEELNGEDINAVKDDRKTNYKEVKETRVKRMNQLKSDKKEMNNIENKMEKLKKQIVSLELKIEESADEGWTVLADLTK
jgi:ATP-binding cassette subfamily F protein uup